MTILWLSIAPSVCVFACGLLLLKGARVCLCVRVFVCGKFASDERMVAASGDKYEAPPVRRRKSRTRVQTKSFSFAVRHLLCFPYDLDELCVEMTSHCVTTKRFPLASLWLYIVKGKTFERGSQHQPTSPNGVTLCTNCVCECCTCVWSGHILLCFVCNVTACAIHFHVCSVVKRGTNEEK